LQSLAQILAQHEMKCKPQILRGYLLGRGSVHSQLQHMLPMQAVREKSKMQNNIVPPTKKCEEIRL